MDLLGAVFIEEFHRLPQLGAPDDAVVHQQQLLVLNELVDGDLLHLGHHVPLPLGGGHKAPGPSGGVLDEGAAEGNLALVGVADGVRAATTSITPASPLPRVFE